MARFVSYLRVSTARQGRSGLGLEAQREAVRAYVEGRAGTIISPEFLETESGKRNDRPQLQAALARCRATGATLVVAKLDRLSRNAAFLLTLRDSGVPFVAADMPEANTLTIGILAVVAQAEREAISARTKAALAAAKARGVKLGNPRGGNNLKPGYGSAAASEAARSFAQGLTNKTRCPLPYPLSVSPRPVKRLWHLRAMNHRPIQPEDRTDRLANTRANRQLR